MKKYGTKLKYLNSDNAQNLKWSEKSKPKMEQNSNAQIRTTLKLEQHVITQILTKFKN